MSKIIDSPEAFYKSIPTSIMENLEFRIQLHTLMEKDTGLQKLYRNMCRIKPHIAFNSMFFTFNPRLEPGFKNVPFILRPAQEDVITALCQGYTNRPQNDVIVDKSRDEGATELICKFIALFACLDTQMMALVGSRNENYVDKKVNFTKGLLTGDHKCLFHKICYALNTCPDWFRPEMEKTHMHLELLDNGSCVDGETTTDNFGAGDRRSIILVDEIGRVDHGVAQSIIDSISDTCDFNIYNSTHFYGAAHPYNRLLQRKSSRTKVVVLPWERNPEKNEGLYRSPDYDQITIRDIDYYRAIVPEIFNDLEPDVPFVLSQLEKDVISLHPDLVQRMEQFKFIADAGDANEGGWRSPWYDSECERRGHSKRDISQNLDRNPIGSGDSFFGLINLRRIRVEDIHEPLYRGELKYKKDQSEQIRKESVFFKDGLAAGSLKVFANLVNGRLNQDHNYVIASDISRGTGNSNSVAQVIDVNLGEQVAILATPNRPPEEFGDLVCALSVWVGGASVQPYHIWEANGPGQAYEKRILFHNITKYYIPKDERARVKKRKNKRGWWSTTGPNGTKYSVLEDLDIALSAGIRRSTEHRSIRIHDVETLEELENYIQYENGALGPASEVSDSVGARSTHGDRVMSLAIALFAMTYQAKAVMKVVETKTADTLNARIKNRKRERIRREREKRF